MRSGHTGGAPTDGDVSAQDDRRIESHFGDYQLITEVARGGMGVVYAARQTRLGRAVALKMILRDRLATPSLIRRFHTEAEAAARLDHPHIVPIYEIGEFHGCNFYSMKWIPGGDLRDWIAVHVRPELNIPGPSQSAARIRPMLRRIVRLMIPIAQAVHHAHQRGILHRDLKPANILLDETDHPYVGDFGLAKIMDDGGHLTRSGTVLGTPAYMAPEQTSLKECSAATTATDVYSLGAILYELLTGKPVFRGSTTLETIRQVAEVDPVPPLTSNRFLDRNLEIICLKCLNKEPHERYASAVAIAEDLQRWLRGEPIHARPVHLAERIGRWCRRKPAIAGLTATVVGLGLVLSVGSLSALIKIRASHEATRWEYYHAAIGLAQKHIRDGDVELARAVLMRCPEEIRHWEWGHLLFLCHQDAMTLDIPNNDMPPLSTESGFGHSLGVTAMTLSTDRLLARYGKQTTVWSFPDGNRMGALTNMPGGGPLETATHPSRSEYELPSPNRYRSYVDPTGKYCVTIDSDSWLALWRHGRDERRLIQLSKLYSEVDPSVVFSPDGRWFTTAALARDARVWELATGDEQWTVGHRIHRAAFSRDGRLLALTGGDPVLKILDMETGRIQRILPGHRSAIQSIAFSPNGDWVASGDRGGTIKVWPTHAGRSIFPHHGLSFAADVSSDGRWLATVHFDDVVNVWEIDTGHHLWRSTGRGTRLLTVAFSADNSKLAVAGDDRRISILNAGTGRFLGRLEGHTASIVSMDHSPSGNLWASASRDGTVRLWNSDTGERLHCWRLPQQPGGLAFSPSGSFLAVTGGAWPEIDRGYVTAFSLTDRAVWFQQTNLNDSPFAIAWHPTEEEIAVGGITRQVRRWNIRDRQEHPPLNCRNSVLALAYSGDGRRLFLGSSPGDTALGTATTEIWNLVGARLSLGLPGHSGQFSPGGVNLLSDGLRLLTVSTGNVLQREAFPWRESDYDRFRGESLAERIRKFADVYWRVGRPDALQPAIRRSPVAFQREIPPIPPRQPDAPERLIDLSLVYTAVLDAPWIPPAYWEGLDNDLRELRPGLHKFSGVLFDVRGVVQLRRAYHGTWGRRIWTRYPDLVRISVGQHAKKIHFLHASRQLGAVANGTRIGGYRVLFSDSVEEIPLVLGENILDWQEDSGADPESTSDLVAWRGSNPASQLKGGGIRLSRWTWENPRPGERIESIEFFSSTSPAAPFLVGITLK